MRTLKFRLFGMSEQHKQISDALAQAHHAAQAGNIEAAIRWAKLAGKLAPRDPLPQLLLGDIALANAQYPAAIKHYREALRRKPDLIAAHGNLGVAWLRQGEYQKAAISFERVLRFNPDDAAALLNLGHIAQAQGQAELALRHYQHAITVDPICVEAYNNAGVLQFMVADYAASIELLEQALQIAPSYTEALNNLGNTLRAAGRLSEAIAAYRKASETQPEHAGTWNNLGNALVDRGDFDEGLAALRQAVEIKPDYASAFSNWLMALNYVPQISLDALRQAHEQFDQRFGGNKNLTRATSKIANSDERIRIGYVSPDFRQHPVAHLIEPILAETDRTTVEVICYSDVAKADSVTERLQSYGHSWRNIHGKSDDEVAALVRRDRVNILVDLAGHTALGRPLMFARRVAPLQVSWLGYFSTTGIAAMDYFIGDATCTPLEWQPYFVEKLALLPYTRFCYRPPLDAPAVADLPATKSKQFTFGCFNNLAKLNPGVIAVWSRILLEIPDSRLILQARFLDDPLTCKTVQARFKQAGAPLDRLEMRGQVAHADLLQAYGEIDLALDPFPFCGGITTLESLWMGVPVLTLQGDRVAGRQSASFLQVLDLQQFIAKTAEEYVRLALEIRAQPEHLSSIRNTLRKCMQASRLCSEQSFTRELEALYKLIN